MKMNRKIEIIWYWGEPGTGKSQRAFENFSDETHFNANIHGIGGCWTGYRNQKIVILNDYVGGQKVSFADLEWANKGIPPITMPNHRNLEKIIITSLYPPEILFDDEDLQTLNTFCEGISIVKLE